MMTLIRENNLQDAFVKSLVCILTSGKDVEGRFNTNNMTKELHPCIFEIQDPTRRTLLCPKRGNNPFSTLAETLWVLAGRNDVEWLEKFLPRAKDFSDDGIVWRAGYGPRLRQWKGDWDSQNDDFDCIDQIQYVIKQLVKDRQCRQAVISIWDPAKECTVEKTKDYACCNWIHFMIRENALDCNVVIRSNDAIWGMSSINMYEWSVLQEIVAGCLDVPVGKYYQMSDSYHIYEPHYKKAEEIIENHIPFSNFNELPIFEFFDGSHIPADMNTPQGKLNLTFEEIETIVSNIEQKVPAYDLPFHNKNFVIINNLLVMYKEMGQESNSGSNVWFAYKELMAKIPFSDLKVAIDYWYIKNILKVKDQGLLTINGCIERCRS